MIMLIDVSYFTEGSRQIQNASVKPSSINAEAVNKRIEGYITSLEERYLTYMLGSGLALRVLEATAEDANPAYVEIREKLKEPFADFVFFNMLNDMNSTPTVTGLVQLKTANSYVAPIDRQVAAWNRMVELHVQFVEWAKSDECPLKIRVSSNMLSKINNLNL